ncbi:LysR family transcriptional regulator [Pontibacillus salipaludis]|uniref:LysR family transcriptional regulator n=1 Tax=Pontibacillus salipaludis TaxID=1697394 RepID=A0ABQ1PX92_9BACI|nr:LysR family transcriptional regulator [Pontibacillus salipaludis]GGD05921.1 LysR family transcriptional regulator [Pontibacillus salipaludis]
MKLQKLQYFIEMAKQKSFTKASNKLHISQPALSKQIKLLEEEIGFALFRRSSKGIELTHKGYAFYQDIEPLFFAIEQKVYQHMNHDEIRFGSTPILSSYFLHEHYEKIQNSNIYITAIQDDNRDLLPMIQSGEIDAAIIQDIATAEAVYSRFLFEDRFVAAIPLSYSLASKESVTLEECFQHPQITTPKGTPFYNRLQERMEEQGMTPDIFETHYHAMAGFVSVGVGIAYLPKMMSRHIEYKGLVFVPIKGEPLKRDMYLHASTKPVLDLLYDLLRPSWC